MTWKEKLRDRIAPDLAQEIDIYETQMELRKLGKIDEKLFAEERPDPWHCQVKPEEKKRIARCVDHGVGQKAGMTPDDVKPAMTQCLA